MKDRELLMWLHERLKNVHGENPNAGHMHQLRVIIEGTPPYRRTVNCGVAPKKDMIEVSTLDGEEYEVEGFIQEGVGLSNYSIAGTNGQESEPRS